MDRGGATGDNRQQASASSAEPDDSEPTPERQAELRAAYDANVATGNTPYEGVEIRTRGELHWVMREHDWSSNYDAKNKERVNLSRTDLFGVNLSGVMLYGVNLSDANLSYATLSDANLSTTNLSGANVSYATLSDANLKFAHFSGADLRSATLSGANLFRAHLSDANLSFANLSGANLFRARMNTDTDLAGATLNARTILADIVWNGVPVTRLNWEDVDMLGDEWVVHQAKDKGETPKSKAWRLKESQDVVLAYRQVATLLRSQGLNEPADRFAYRAQVCQRQVLRRQRRWLQWLWSGLLDGVAGYGYRPVRSVFTYVLVVLVFAALYFGLGGVHGQALSWNESLVVSLTAFHGRGFFATAFQPGDPQAAVAAVEVVIGLLIEITFIATFTNRFFAR